MLAIFSPQCINQPGLHSTERFKAALSVGHLLTPMHQPARTAQHIKIQRLRSVLAIFSSQCTHQPGLHSRERFKAALSVGHLLNPFYQSTRAAQQRNIHGCTQQITKHIKLHYCIRLHWAVLCCSSCAALSKVATCFNTLAPVSAVFLPQYISSAGLHSRERVKAAHSKHATHVPQLYAVSDVCAVSMSRLHCAVCQQLSIDWPSLLGLDTSLGMCTFNTLFS